jgi:hypothetical protein
MDQEADVVDSDEISVEEADISIIYRSTIQKLQKFPSSSTSGNALQQMRTSIEQ